MQALVSGSGACSDLNLVRPGRYVILVTDGDGPKAILIQPGRERLVGRHGFHAIPTLPPYW
jgi:hypothetical protein